MFPFLTQLFLFYFALAITLFLPGYLLLGTFSKRTRTFSRLETFVLSFGLSIAVTDMLMLILGAMHISITRWSLLGVLALFSIITGFIFNHRRSKKALPELAVGLFSRRQFLLIIILIGLSLFIRTLYLSGTIPPSATDLGHHMYWSNVIVTKGIIPNYAKSDVVVSTDGNFSIGKPENISDFIIGEHLIFAGISLITGLSVVSFFPIATLLLINMMTLLAVFILTIRLFEQSPRAKNIAIASLLLLGPIFAITPPQAKFVGGGVIGNIIGNLLVPLALFCFLRALKEKSSMLFMLGMLFSMILFYTHHLTGLIFLLLIVFSILLVLILNLKRAHKIIMGWLRMFFSLPVISFMIYALAFLFFVYMPTYLTNKAVQTVVGGPTKVDHTGVTPTDFKFMIGEPRVAIALAGLLLLLVFSYSKSGLQLKDHIKKISRNILSRRADTPEIEPAYNMIFLFAWTLVITIASMFPTWLGLDIPSSRVANYGVYPFAMIAAFVLVEVFSPHKNKEEKMFFSLKNTFLFSIFIILFSYLITAGFSDNQENITATTITPQKTMQTFHAAEYLAKKISPTDVVLNDHIYTAADTWVKIFFMRDYTFPIYRANLDRYENGIDRKEFCTLNMISTPDAPENQKCFDQLGVNFTMVNKKNDAAQFQKSPDFWQIYSNDEINTYYRPTK